MAKSLQDILKGSAGSKVVPGSTGTKPGVDYDPKSTGGQAFVKKHKTAKFDDRAGNTGDVYAADNVKKSLDDKKNDKLKSKEDQYEEHLGFTKLKNKLSHEKGVTDPAGLAAAIGRKKYGAKKFNSAATNHHKISEASGTTPLKQPDDAVSDAKRTKVDASVRQLNGGHDQRVKKFAAFRSEAKVDLTKGMNIDYSKVKKIAPGVTSGIKSSDFKKAAQTGEKIAPVIISKVDPKSLAPSATFRGTHAHTKHVKEGQDVGEEHLGFAKLKGKLSHEKGVKDPEALAASIGRKKFGAKKFSNMAHHESAEDVQELSRETLKNYVTKGAMDRATLRSKQDEKSTPYKTRKIANRSAGIKTAVGKITAGGKMHSEDAEGVQEVSKGILRSYLDAASRDTKLSVSRADNADRNAKYKTVVPRAKHISGTSDDWKREGAFYKKNADKRVMGMHHADRKIFGRAKVPATEEVIVEHVAAPESDVKMHHDCLSECGWNMCGKLEHKNFREGKDVLGADHIYKRHHMTGNGRYEHKVVVRSPDKTWAHFSRKYDEFKPTGFEGKGHASLKKMIGVLKDHPLDETTGPDSPMTLPSTSTSPPMDSYPGGFGFHSADTPANI
jgi:hypothetical protein